MFLTSGISGTGASSGLGALFAREMKDGPLPTHYEPWETPVDNLLYPEQTRNPVVQAPLQVDRVAKKRRLAVDRDWMSAHHSHAGDLVHLVVSTRESVVGV